MSPTAAVVRVAWTPGRAEPSHRSEMVTQWLCGERLTVEESTGGSADGGEGGWLRVTGPDGYTSWVDAGGVLRVGAAEADRWEEEADRISLGTELRAAASTGEAREGEAGEGHTPSSPDAAPRFLPWGARVAGPEGRAGGRAREAGGGDRAGGRVRLPDGGEAEVADPDRLVPREECVLRFPPRADAVLATASAWRGVPYLWGGRTRQGVDCSGLVQAVLALHGCGLPRDSDLQMRADEPVWRRVAARDRGTSAGDEGPGEGGDDGAADLLALAREVLRPGDLLFFGEGTEFGADDEFGENAESAARGDVGENAEHVTHVAFHAEDTLILHAAAGRGQVTCDDLAAGDPLMERLRDRLLAVTRPLARTDGESGG